jgi:hypothetical protein
MNCLESRRRLLAGPRDRAGDLNQHLGSCEACKRFAEELAKLDREVAEAASVRTPEALTERILLARRGTRRRQYALAATLLVGSAVTAMAAAHLTDAALSRDALEVVGPAHPGVAAISEVAEDATPPAPAVSELQRNPEQVLKRLGLAVKKGEATTYYVGKCHILPSDCEHIVLSTGDLQANVIVVSDYPLGRRVVVADRHMTALVNPTQSGGYIVVADKPRTARRIEKLFVKG